VENRWLEIRQATFYPGRAIVLTGRGVDKICALRARVRSTLVEAALGFDERAMRMKPTAHS
jgi:hypothetical protein